MINKFFKKHYDTLYVIFRVIVGLLFFVHGGQKLFGWFGSKGAAELGSMMGAAGVIETVVGVAIAIGLFARLAALIGSLEMIAAYCIAHVPRGILPYENGGELALLYLAAFFVIIINGSKKASVEKALCKGKECF
jgi:putative oxidoreductase